MPKAPIKYQPKQPRIVRVPVPMDPDVERVAQEARNALEDRAQELLTTFNHRATVHAATEGMEFRDAAKAVYEADQAELKTLEGEFKAAQAALREGCREFTFRPLGFKRWRELKAEYPSKDKDLAFDLDAMAPALLREAGGLTAAEVDEILTDPAWSEGEVLLLLTSAVSAQS
jgi:hypothetical protein